MTKEKTRQVRMFNEEAEWMLKTSKALGIKNPQLMKKIIRSSNLDLDTKILEEIKNKLREDERNLRKWSLGKI